MLHLLGQTFLLPFLAFNKVLLDVYVFGSLTDLSLCSLTGTMLPGYCHGPLQLVGLQTILQAAGS